jgi:hypothetical protein
MVNFAIPIIETHLISKNMNSVISIFYIVEIQVFQFVISFYF